MPAIEPVQLPLLYVVLSTGNVIADVGAVVSSLYATIASTWAPEPDVAPGKRVRPGREHGPLVGVDPLFVGPVTDAVAFHGGVTRRRRKCGAA